MPWKITSDPHEHAAAVLPLLRSDPQRHTLALTVLESLQDGHAYSAESPLFAHWTDSRGTVCGAAVHTPPHELLLSTAPAHSIAPLAEALYEAGHAVGGIHAARSAAETFARRHAELTGAAWRTFARHRLYRLRTLLPPEPAPTGRARLATGADRALLREWLDAFRRTTGQINADLERDVDRGLRRGAYVLWEDPRSGTAGPVSMAGRTEPAFGTVRIGPLFTPAEHRRRGYGAAVVAAASSMALADGAQGVVLFADLDNPTSNHIYQRLGYAPVEDRLIVHFA
ncbi:GNAT family N-acetyltransferase [Allostreptomyces psammosilenae]|uniref:Putative GNAT family acetyltransferase n=1 Tax=Allostreptomyces psammosilenae TaxID=1892865 RepID=A0A852ZUA3_9ACTN|nr:GNAT family N-acetyltransferase [Allostreptomyces psammosilenae]NYI05147.1 putative GNAT family acetyltransferase [Allostreptomyces psammosilenae]